MIMEELKLSYTEFLFYNLMMDSIPLKDVPYDELFPQIPMLYECFLESDENIETKSEYDCIVKYIRNNESFIVNCFREFL